MLAEITRATIVQKKLPIAIGLITSAMVALSFISNTWVGELACSFRAYYSFLLVATAIAMALKKRLLILLFFIIVAVINALPILPLYQQDKMQRSTAAISIRLMQVNVQRENLSFTKLIEYIKKTKPDIIAVEECTPASNAAFLVGLPEYHYHVSRPEQSYWGMGIYSKLAINSPEFFIPKINGPDEPAIICTLQKDGHDVRVAAVHVWAPALPQSKQTRDAQLNQIAERLKPVKTPTILLGDLNTTPWSFTCNQFQNALQLKDSRNGFGLLPTCCVAFMWIPIDYCLIPQAAQATHCEVGPEFGSDHCPVLVTVEIPIPG